MIPPTAGLSPTDTHTYHTTSVARSIISVSDWGVCDRRFEKLKCDAKRAESANKVGFLGRDSKPPPHHLSCPVGSGGGGKAMENVALKHFAV